MRQVRKTRVGAASSNRETPWASLPLGETLREIFRRLSAAHGPQHWWPADEPFEVMVGAILTQSTAWANVAIAIRNLKTAHALSPQAIGSLPAEELAALIRPSGYYTAKTRKLKALVSWVEDHGCELSRLFAETTAQLRQELLAVYGIGEETADSILLYAAGKPVFVIDAYTRRIVDRVGIRPEGNTYGDYQRLFLASLPPDVAMFNEYHALFVEHGKRVCRETPACPKCCLQDICNYGMSVTSTESAAAQDQEGKYTAKEGHADCA